MTDSSDLIVQHVQVLFKLNSAGRMIGINDSGRGAPPRFFRGQGPDGESL